MGCNSGTPRLRQSDDVVRRPTCVSPKCDCKGLGRQLTSSPARVGAIEILLTMLRTDLSADKLHAFVPSCNDAFRAIGIVGIMIGHPESGKERSNIRALPAKRAIGALASNTLWFSPTPDCAATTKTPSWSSRLVTISARPELLHPRL